MAVIGDAKSQRAAVADGAWNLPANIARRLAVRLKEIKDGCAGGDSPHCTGAHFGDSLGNFFGRVPLAQGALSNRILLEMLAQTGQTVQHSWAAAVAQLVVIDPCATGFAATSAGVMLAPAVDLLL